MSQRTLANPMARGGDIGRVVIRGSRFMLAGLLAPRGDRLALRPRLWDFHPLTLPLRRHLSPYGGDSCGARSDGGENSTVEEVILTAGEQLPLVHGAAAGADGDRLLGGEVVEEHVMLRLVEGESAGVADRRVQPGGQEALPVVRIEEEPALAADGADLPAGADPLARFLLAVVNGASRRPDSAAVAGENDGARGVAPAELANGLRGLSPVRIDDELLDAGGRAIFPRPLAPQEPIDQRREPGLERGLEAAGVNIGKRSLGAGGGEVLAGLLGMCAVGQEVAAVASAPGSDGPEEQPLLDVDRDTASQPVAAELGVLLPKVFPVRPLVDQAGFRTSW